MIYIAQPQLPITYAQFNFSIDHSLSLSSTTTNPELNSALRILTQRQLVRGTIRATRAQFINEIEKLGTELQLTHRGYAHSVGAVTLTRMLPQFLSFIREALTEPRFDLDEIEQSKRAYISELEARYDDDQALAWLWLSRCVYQGHPLFSHYNVLPQHIEAISFEAIREAWPKLFHTELFLPTFTTDLEAKELESLLVPIYESLARLNLADSSHTASSHNSHKQTQKVGFKPCLIPSLKQLKGNQLTLVKKAGKKQALLFIAQPTIEPEHPQALALYVALCALGGTFSSPLMQEIRVKRGLSYGAHASIKGEGHSRFVCLNCTPEVSQASEAFKVMLEVYQRAIEGALSDDEIIFAKEYLINAHPFSIETPAMRAGLSANAQLMGLDPKLIFTQAQRIQALSTQEIRQAAQDLLSKKGLHLLAFGDYEQGLATLEQDLKDQIQLDRIIQVEAKDECIE